MTWLPEPFDAPRRRQASSLNRNSPWIYALLPRQPAEAEWQRGRAGGRHSRIGHGGRRRPWRLPGRGLCGDGGAVPRSCGLDRGDLDRRRQRSDHRWQRSRAPGRCARAVLGGGGAASRKHVCTGVRGRALDESLQLAQCGPDPGARSGRSIHTEPHARRSPRRCAGALPAGAARTGDRTDRGFRSAQRQRHPA
jgi:hypothetical protein